MLCPLEYPTLHLQAKSIEGMPQHDSVSGNGILDQSHGQTKGHANDKASHTSAKRDTLHEVNNGTHAPLSLTQIARDF